MKYRFELAIEAHKLVGSDKEESQARSLGHLGLRRLETVPGEPPYPNYDDPRREFQENDRTSPPNAPKWRRVGEIPRQSSGPRSVDGGEERAADQLISQRGSKADTRSPRNKPNEILGAKTRSEGHEEESD